MTEELTIKYRQEAIAPFWRKLPFFFLFPLRFGPALFIACILAASAASGLVLGAYGMVFRGLLAYLGLRYAFNVLELFSKGRFEGHSMDHSLWGPEKRPAKLGLVIALFIAAGAWFGGVMLDSRLANDPRAQQQIVDRYNKAHAAEIEQRRQEMAVYEKLVAEEAASRARREAARAQLGEDSQGEADGQAMDEAQPELELQRPEPGPTREQILEDGRPAFGQPLWFRLQPVSFWLVMGVLSLLLPAAAVVIALEDRFFKALNPLNVIHLVQAMGSAYLVLWAFFLLIAGTRQLALVAGEGWPAAVRFPLEMGLATYLSLVLFALMGYALYQFHQELHLDVDVDFDEHRVAGGAEAIAQAGSARAALSQAQPQDPLERKIQPMVAEGRFKDAIAEVKDHMRYDRFDAALNTRLHALYALQGDDAATLAHGQQWLSALARAGQDKQVLAALRELQALNREFTVQDGDAILPAASAALRAGEHALAAGLLRQFDKRFPGHKDIPGAFFLGARMLSEHSRQHEKAVVILRAVLARFPDHAIAAEVRAYLDVLERMLAKAAAPG